MNKDSLILNEKSPKILKSNYNIALNSIKRKTSSIEYVIFDDMTKEEINNIIDELIKNGYVLSFNSPLLLRSNLKLVLSSINKKPDIVEYVPDSLYSNLEIDQASYNKLSNEILALRPAINYQDKEMMRTVLEKLFISKNKKEFNKFIGDSDSNKYLDRLSSLYSDSLSISPTVNSLKKVLMEFTELQWEDHRSKNMNNYSNIFSKICNELQNNHNFDNINNKLDFMYNMKKSLGNRFDLLLKAMNEYHLIYHHKLNKSIDESRDTIARLSALYVSISKENYKKKMLMDDMKDIKKMFIPRKDHPLVHKKIVEYKQMQNFKELYWDKNTDVCNYINEIKNKYSECFDKDYLNDLINRFLLINKLKKDSISDLANCDNDIDKYLEKKKLINGYNRYLEAKKLVNRLNKGYIKYTDQELNRYVDIIKFDSSKNIYYYCGTVYSKEQIDEYNKYNKELLMFEEIKKEIVFKAKEIYSSFDISNKELKEISNELIFDDEYFEFDKEYVANTFSVDDLIDRCTKKASFISKDSILDDDAYQLLRKYIIDNGLIWFLLAMGEYRESLKNIGISKDELINTFDYMKGAFELSKVLKYEFKTYKDMLLMLEIVSCANAKTIAILGVDNILKLIRNMSYSKEKPVDVVNAARELVANMCTRDYSTVPYISGDVNGYHYSMYDSQDNDILFSGIDTDSCFRIGGYDNDFLHYCALDKNGFIIKITNSLGEFIGRAAGFRNGNAVYINQLRTIYDSGGTGYEGKDKLEKKELIETFYDACRNIINTSQNNPNEKDKIDYVFVTKSYLLKHIESNVDWLIRKKIGKKPMDLKSNDWENFSENTKNLKESLEEGYFMTDYGIYPIICVATSKTNKIGFKSVVKKDVVALYPRKRNPIIISSVLNEDINSKINKIRGIYSYKNKIKYQDILNIYGSKYFVGDNWYIIYYPDGRTDGIVLDNDKKASIEYEEVMKAINDTKQKVLVKNML